MKKSRDYFALDWIKAELDQTLAAARQALEEFALPEHDRTRIRACLTHLHQVHGTLVMLELGGVAVLADEMERLAQALSDDIVTNVEAAQQVLMQGILQLPAFLEEIQKGLPDSRRAILPLANELRAARGEAPFPDSPGAGIVNLRAAAAEDTLARFKDIDGVEKARKIRGAYQQVLLAILRGDYGPKVVGTLTKVAIGLERICERTPMAALWSAFGVFVKSLEGEARLSSDVIKLLRRVDAELKVLASEGRNALARPLSTELVRALVDAAASRGFRSVELDGLNSALADSSDDEAAAPQSSGIAGHQALQTAAAALREEITSVKDQLDLLVRSGEPTLDQLRQLSAPLKRIGSTLSVLGFESSRAIVADQVDSLSAIAANGSIDDSVLMGVAAALLQVDENLTAVTEQRRRPVGVGEPSAIIDDAQLTVLAEARNGLEHVKQCVVDYVSSNWDRTRLSEVPSLLGAVRGALTMVTLTRPADLLGRCSAFVERKLLSGKIPDWVTLDTFADAISGVDYYLERLCEQTSPGEDIVTRVERSVQLLEGARLLDEAPPNEPDEARGDRTLGRVFDDNMPEDAPLLEDEATESFVLTDEAEAALAEQPAGDRDADLSGVRDDTADETAVDAVLEDIAEEARDHAVPMHAARSPAEDAGSDTFELVLEEEDGQPAVRPTSPSELQFDLSSELFDEVADDEPSEPSSPPVLRVVPKAPREDSVAKAPAAPPPPPPAPVVATSTAAPTLDEPDQEIIEIFIEEVAEVLESLDGAIDTWSASNLGDVAALKEVRRAFHTLKGSGRIVGAKAIGELAWAVENLLNRVIDETLEPNRQIVAVVREARALVPGLRDAFRARSACDEAAVERVSERADLLASGGELEDLASDAEVSAPAATTTTEPIEPEIDEELERTIEEVIEIEAVADDVTEVNEPEVTDEVGEPVDETRTLFARELAQLLDTIDEARDREPTGEALARALHTVRGSASMAGVENVERLVSPVYQAVLAAIDAGVKSDPDLATLLGRGSQALRTALHTLEAGGETSDTPAAELGALSERFVARLRGAKRESTPLVMLDGAGVLMEARDFLKSWLDGALDLSQLAEVVAALHDVRNQAESQERTAVVELCDALGAAYERLEDQPLPIDAFEALDTGHDLLLAMFDRIAAQQALPPHAAVVAALERAGIAVSAEETDDVELGASARVIEFPQASTLRPTPPPSPEPETPKAVETFAKPDVPKPTALVPPPARTKEISTDTVARDSTLLPPDVDPEILDIFFEESDELLETIDHGIHEWLVERDNQVYLENLLRALHTLKGGARLAGLSKLGDETHEFESFLGDPHATRSPTDAFFRTLQKKYDDLTNHVSALRTAAGRRPADSAPPVAAEVAPPAPVAPAIVAPTTKAPSTPELPVTPPVVEAPKTVAAPPVARVERAEPARVPQPAPSAARVGTPPEDKPPVPSRPAADREMVRVSAGLLEQLVNLAGESSIVRSRIEQGISDFAIALEEMETTIERVREQLRRLEIETEARMLFRHERHSGPQYEDFDPLEMDRYSQLQQLSKGLSESASDMLDLKETLAFKARESETLLIQQARINTELQEGLMRTRMVPFSRLVPRLRRIVRQVAEEVGKEAELHVYNAEGELDRNVLERMVPPLEHMLRNAIDHGIESPDMRRNFGKTDLGRIDLRLSREAGDVVIEIADDGAGIDVESVRAKAVERGLMAPDARLSDDEVLQFVFAPGFSTAKSVTQISGRGVGMDVVHSTVKQLGGSIQITSVPGKGTRFTVRLPFTVSVNRALMVSINDDLYAVPLNTIEGIVRISAAQLEEMYSPSGRGFEYAGVQYRVRYLGSYIGREYKPRPEQGSVPVVLLRTGDIAMAIHVDGVAGSREIVVKSLGPQFAGVSGVSGATILGDGSVVVILDLLALVRAQMPVHHHVVPPLAEKRDRPRCVMVVDDSVTVRKVTSRLLERQGMDVMVAKDGVEAIAMLQERRPDILLLDIEMPRMDGFEVARQIRHDERLSKLPIVMISSRTGAKHQEHAVELGVNRFLGKPFQESELLSTIDELVN